MTERSSRFQRAGDVAANVALIAIALLAWALLGAALTIGALTTIV